MGFNSGPPIVPAAYNQNIQIFQTSDHVVVLHEMVHDARIVPLDGRDQLPEGVRQWMGSPRGRGGTAVRAIAAPERGRSAAKLDRFLTPLVEAGVDVFHASTRRFNDPEFEGSDLNLAGWAKKITGLSAITVVSVGLNLDFLRSTGGGEAHKVGLDALVLRLEREEFNLVAVGRGLLSDPAWARKLQDGRENEIVAFEPRHMGIFE